MRYELNFHSSEHNGYQLSRMYQVLLKVIIFVIIIISVRFAQNVVVMNYSILTITYQLKTILANVSNSYEHEYHYHHPKGHSKNKQQIIEILT